MSQRKAALEVEWCLLEKNAKHDQDHMQPTTQACASMKGEVKGDVGATHWSFPRSWARAPKTSSPRRHRSTIHIFCDLIEAIEVLFGHRLLHWELLGPYHMPRQARLNRYRSRWQDTMTPD